MNLRPWASRARAADRGGPRPPILRSIRTRLAVTFFLVTFLSVAVIYVIVAPPLTSGLQNQGVRSLETLVANSYASQQHTYDALRAVAVDAKTTKSIKREQAYAEKLLTKLASRTASQVSLIRVSSAAGTGAVAPVPATFASNGTPQLIPGEANSIDIFALSVQPGNVPPKTAVTRVIGGPRGPLGVVGIGISRPSSSSTYKVVVFSRELDIAPLVASVRSRILIAAALGLLVALLTGVLVARALTRRVLRLESTAQRVAQGDFGAHFSDSSGDELGQLASALAHMQSQLEGLENARRRFIATASHELRTPIFSLGGFVELLQNEALDEETRRQFLGQVGEQADRLGKLATQLLDLTRLESGTVEMQTTTTDLGVLARAVGAEFAPALARHESRLDLRIPPDAIRVVCDGERVAQLLRILIDNAIAHTPPGTDVVVTASAPGYGTGAQLSVTDAGPGISDEVIDRIFEPFYSADGVRGAGLGLAIARELAGRMGATLEIASAPGNTTFTLTLAQSARQ